MNIENEKYKSEDYEVWFFGRRIIGVHQNDMDVTNFSAGFNMLPMGVKKDICSNSAFVANSAILNMMNKHT